MNQFYDRLFFVINVKRKKAKRISKIITDTMADQPFTYSILRIEGQHFDSELDQVLMRHFTIEKTLLVVVGGDGTLNFLVNYLENNHIDDPVAYLPGGSGNDFARSMAMPDDFEQALRQLLLMEQTQTVDILNIYNRLTGENLYGVNSIGFGIDSNTIRYSEESQSWLKRILGRHTYASGVPLAYFRQKEFHVELYVDNQGLLSYDHCKLCLVANNPYLGGGIKLHPEADNQDGFFNILLADGVEHKEALKIVSLLLADQSHLDQPKLHHFKCKKARMIIKPAEYGQIDGEILNKEPYDLDITLRQRQLWI